MDGSRYTVCRGPRRILLTAHAATLLLLLLLLDKAALCEASWNGLCNSELIESSLDGAFTASSFTPDCPAHLARRSSTAGCAAWCPALAGATNEWLQVDFGRIVSISFVETYGRFADGRGSEFVSEYKLKYNRGDGRGFVWYVQPQDRQSLSSNSSARELAAKVFEGNVDTSSSRHSPTNHLVALSIRIVPIVSPTSVARPCLRIEAYGCPTDGVISYSVAPQPPDSWSGLSTGDRPYDGFRQERVMQGGLGILTDGDVGTPINRILSNNTLQGQGWMGWPMHDTPVVLTFEFDAVRNFSSIRVHSYDDDQLSVRVFNRSVWQCSQQASVYLPGQQHVFVQQRQPIADSLLTSSAAALGPGPVPVELTFGSSRPCIGKYIKVELHRTRGWLLVSEISFKSVVVGRSMTAAPSAVPNAVSWTSAPARAAEWQQPMREGNHQQAAMATGSALDVTASLGGPIRDEAVAEDPGSAIAVKPHRVTDLPPDAAVLGGTSHTIGVIAGVGAGAIVLIICLVVALCLCHVRARRRRALQSEGSGNSKHNPEREFRDPLYSSSSHEHPSLRQHSNGFNGGYRPETITVNGVGYMGLPQKDGIYEEPWSHCHPAERPPFGCTAPPNMNGTVPCNARNYAIVPPESACAPNAMLPPSSVLLPPDGMVLPPSNYLTGRLHMLPPPPLIPSVDDKPLPLELLNTSIEGAAGNSLMSGCKFTDVCAETLSAIMPYHLGRQSLHFVEKLGEGRFGEIHLCEVLESESTYGSLLGSGSQCPPLVVMKILRRDVNDNVRNGFYQELATAAQFRDPNVAGVLSAYASDESPYMVLEYSEQGDLHEYLSRRSSSVAFDPNSSTGSVGFQKGRGDMSRGSLVYIACQVASGMKYLENVGVVHRDLSARNVLVGELYAVKITDIAMSRRRNAPAYYCVGGKTPLPVRWMAPESLYTGKFSSRSDVWSFGVLLWEVFTFAQTPYQQLGDEQVLEAGLRAYRSAILHSPVESLSPAPLPVLQRPGNCLKEVYDLMLECWNVAEGARPAFREIHMFLLRKNVGYDPQQDLAASSGRLLSDDAMRQLHDDSRFSLSMAQGGRSASPGQLSRDESSANRLLASGRKS